MNPNDEKVSLDCSKPMDALKAIDAYTAGLHLARKDAALFNLCLQTLATFVVEHSPKPDAPQAAP